MEEVSFLSLHPDFFSGLWMRKLDCLWRGGEQFPVGIPDPRVIDLIPHLVEGWGPWEDYVVAGGEYDPDYGIPRELGMVTASAPPLWLTV